MKTKILTLLGVALLVAPATAAPVPVQDRIADLCQVSNTDLEGQRLARACRAAVRAQAGAEERAAVTRRGIRTANATPVLPR